MTQRPLAATFHGPTDRAFLLENRETWTVGRLLALAADIARSVEAGAGPVVGVRSGSASFILSSLLGLWSSGRCGLLADPALRCETSRPEDRGVSTWLVSSPDRADGPAETLVRESGCAPLSPALPTGDDPFVVFLTSGATGAPKTVRKSAFQFERQHDVEPGRLGLPGSPSVLCFVPAFHILGFLYGLYLPAASGGRACFCTGGAPDAWVELIRRSEPDLVVGVPSHYRLMAKILERPLPKAVYLSSGAPLSEDVGAAFLDLAGHPVVQVYGSTESGGVATRIGADPWRPLPGLRWRIDDASRLWIAAPWQSAPDEWTATDDAAAPAAEGFLLLGRSDSIVKVAGRRFSVDEVVQAARSLPAVDQAAAVLYERYGEAAVALFVTARPGAAPLDGAQVREHLQRCLAPFKRPRTVRVLDSLPLRGIGKVDLAKLQALARSG